METRENTLLGGKVTLHQPVTGFRSGIDAVFLAANLSPKKESWILDVGCGVGAATLCLLERCPSAHVTGIDVQAEYIALATKNSVANNRENSTTFIAGNLLSTPHLLTPNSFDHVMSNPPYFSSESYTAPSANDRAVAHVGAEITLGEWLSYCLKMLKPKGMIHLIYRAERVGEIITHLASKTGAITLRPLWPKPGRNAKLVLVSAIKGSKAPFILAHGITVHQEDGSYSQEAERILREGKTIDSPTATCCL